MNNTIGILYNLFSGDGEKEFDFDTQDTINWLSDIISEKYDVLLLEDQQKNKPWVNSLINNQPRAIFNIAEGYNSSVREAFFAALLEQLGIPYTGPGPIDLMICQDKIFTKSLLKLAHCPVPDGFVVQNSKFLLDNPKLKFPLIVKPNTEGSSYGISQNSTANSIEELKELTELFFTNFNTNLLIEEFISGSDYSVSYVQGLGIFGPVKYSYPGYLAKNNIHDFNLKVFEHKEVNVFWDNNIDEKLKENMLSISKVAVEALDIQGYCRIDFRVSHTNQPYILEINGQVCFNPESSFLVAFDKEGIAHRDVVHHIIEYALRNPRKSSSIGNLLYSKINNCEFKK